MKKIALFTIHGYYNYGNRLQNYATQQLLSSFGYEVDTIIFKPSILRCIKDLVRKVISCKYKNSELFKSREAKFRAFSVNYISEKYTSMRLFDSSNYAFFATGSDIVWGPPNTQTFLSRRPTRFLLPSPYFLPFGRPEQRFSISASCAVSLNDFYATHKNYLKLFSKYIRQIEHISVREKTGVEIIINLVGKKATCLLDPTLLITEQEWNRIATKPKFKIPENYLFIFMLGKVTEEYEHLIFNVARELGCSIVRLNDPNLKDMYCTDPAEFVWLIKHAARVITDSFHVIAFSIIYKVKFWSLQRVEPRGGLQNISSRITNILELFNLKGDGTDNFHDATKIIKTERDKAICFLSFLVVSN